MEEIDIENAEDLNELESRLFEQAGKTTLENATQLLEDNGMEMTSENASYDLGRYRNSVRGERTGNQWHSQHHTNRFIRNPFKTPLNNKQDRQNAPQYLNEYRNQRQPKQFENRMKNFLKTNEHDILEQNNNKEYPENTIFSKSTQKSVPQDVAFLSSYNENKKSKTGKADQNSEREKMSGEKANLKLNPIADWMERKKNRMNRKTNSKNNNVNAKNAKISSIDINQGLFARQQQKLLRAKRIEDKKKKSQKARDAVAARANKIMLPEIIDLNSDNESDSSDVIMIPSAPLPTYILDDSGDENNKNKMPDTIEQEENALDATDVQMSSISACFIKPQQIVTQSLADGGEKRFENLSRCTSPCSLQSSDDFIGQTDRTRLLAGASAVADDEDLLLLTTDMNSLLETPNVSKKVDEQLISEKEGNSRESSVKQLQNQNIETNDSLEFAAPETTKQQSRSKDYRVDQGQFRALDVYESESDITDSVYSKGANKPTVIRQVDTSSEEVEDIGVYTHRTKRLCKRRASSSNKESDPNNTNFATSSDNEEDEEDDNEVLRTPIPFIAKGPAVERYKSQKRYIHKRKSANKTVATTDHMSDTEFIATLNNLAQGQDGEQENQVLEEVEDSETEKTPTAREIAEKILAQQSLKETPEKSSTDDMALPEGILNKLEKVFETIDQLDKQNTNQLFTVDDTVKISDSSDSDREKHFIYKSLPGEEAQIIEFCPPRSKTSLAKNGSPIYNVIYSRGRRKLGGLGWNDEMRKFYNESWNGEHFKLSKILQTMNPDKSLWKIYKEDRFNIKSNKRSNIKCTNCCEYGHMRSKCKSPRKPVICYMCGDSGHYEPRCPNTICLRCGNKTQVFTRICNACSYQNRLTCPICKIRGHSLDYCPDKWRRYHSTTEANAYPNSAVHYNPRKFCCVCGGRGHISDNCRSAVRFSEYPAISSAIKSHQKSYNDVAIKAPQNCIALNMMYDVCQEYKFDLVALTSSDKYYGRFLKSVGMDYLLKRKRQTNAVNMKTAETNAKKAKRFSKKYKVNPLKAGTAHQKAVNSIESAPDQVQEITESGNSDQQDNENRLKKDVINIEDKSDNSENEVEIIDCTAKGYNLEDIEINTICGRRNAVDNRVENFKSPKNVISTSLDKPSTQISLAEPAHILDSDSNYSFSEHFDLASNSDNVPASAETHDSVLSPSLAKILTEKEHDNESVVTGTSRPKPREMGIFPDFIPHIDSTKDLNEQAGDHRNSVIGISRKFVAADSDEEIEKNRRDLGPLPELPCEAKIYLTHFHSRYLLSPAGNAFLVKISRACKLNARLDFTSVGHVLVIYGLPTNQDKLQRELLMKYRELEDEKNHKQLQSNLNVPKRTYVLIRFLRDNITQLMNNLGNVNHLLKRLQFLERQRTKSGFKLAEKVRRSLNMILVGQAGLQDGTMHLDKLLISLKKLLNDVRDDVAPPELRSEITDHWKVIFSAYRHENYQKLVDTYNQLISENRMPQLNFDPILLGQKVLDTHFNEEQKQNLEQHKAETSKNATDTNTTTRANDTCSFKAKMKLNSNNTSTPLKFCKTSINSSPLFKTKAPSSTTETGHKSKQFTSTTNATPTALTINANAPSKQQSQKIILPPTFVSPEKHSTVTTAIPEVVDKWKSTCDTLLAEINSKKAISNKNNMLESKLPSVFWSRESMRYLNDCIRLAAARPQIMEKLQRVQYKCKNCQLSYNDYLAVIKLHTALNGN